MKKQSTLKRALALGMSATMVGATLAGCGGSASSTAATSTETASSAATEAETTTDSDKPFAGTTLTWYTTLNGNVSDNYANLGDTPWAKYVQERTGITIEFQHPTQGSEAEEFAVMLASGEYPDIIEYTWTTYSGGAGAAINDGVIISLDDYMADATNLSKVMQEHPEIGKMIKSSGGNYYCFPCLRGLESPNKTEFSSGFLYRADALADLGFDQVPETIDEWEEVLRAAKAAGYSKPFTTRKEWVKDVWSAAYDNWGSFYVDDGVVKNGLMEDSRKDFIQKMADWYAEGLLDNDWMQADKKSTQTDFVSGNCILGYAPFGQGLGNYTKAMMEADPNFKEEYIQAAAPVTSTKGKNAKFSKMNNIYDQSGASAAISSQCKNVEAAVWLLDWLYSEEGQICYNFGIEGESYEMKDGKPVYTDLILNNPDGMSVAQALAAYTRASTSGAGIQSEDYIDQYYAQDNQKKALELSMKTDMGEHMFPPTSVSEENQDRYSEIMSQVKTLADEMEASFICGTTPMSEWDSYQQKLKDAGKICYSVGYNIDMLSTAPTAALTSATNVWSVCYKELIEGAQNGSIPQNWCKGYEDGAVAITDLGPEAAEGTAAKVAEVEAALKDGSLHVFDTSKFTVDGAEVTTAPIDLTYYDFSTGSPVAVYQGETKEAVSDGYFHEGELRAAPTFSLRIDGIIEDADPVA